MNVISLLTPKTNVAWLYEDWTIRQGLEKLRFHGYTAIPVLAKDGSYVGTVSEGDFLWCLLDQGSGDIQTQEKQPLRRDNRPGFNPAVRIDVALEELVERALRQSFIPVVDDRGAFVGIVTRQNIIKRLTVLNVEQPCCPYVTGSLLNLHRAATDVAAPNFFFCGEIFTASGGYY